MKSKKILIRFLVQSVFAITFPLLLSSCADVHWEWKADPWVADSASQSIWNADAKQVKASDPGFDDFTCFPSENIKELKENIDRLKIPKQYKSILLGEVDKIFASNTIKGKGAR